MKKKACIVDKKKFPEKCLRQPSIDFDKGPTTLYGRLISETDAVPINVILKQMPIANFKVVGI